MDDEQPSSRLAHKRICKDRIRRSSTDHNDVVTRFETAKTSLKITTFKETG